MRAFFATLLLSFLTQAEERAYRVIVHPSNTATAIDRRFLSDAFLKKVTQWPQSGGVIRPVDQRSDSRVREKFSDEVVGRSVSAVKSYWQQAIFSGRDVPPPELDSDEEVVKYVLKHPGAIGYVSTKAELNGVTVLPWK